MLLCKLMKKGKVKKRGDVTIRMAFHFEKNTGSAFQEYVHLLKNVILHEIKTSQVSRVCSVWCVLTNVKVKLSHYMP
jgi:hypothetical protein